MGQEDLRVLTYYILKSDETLQQGMTWYHFSLHLLAGVPKAAYLIKFEPVL